MYTTILVNVLHLLISNELKQVTIVTRNLNVFEIMNEIIKDLIYEFEEGHIDICDFVHKLKMII